MAGLKRNFFFFPISSELKMQEKNLILWFGASRNKKGADRPRRHQRSAETPCCQIFHITLGITFPRGTRFCLLWQTAALKFYEEERDFKTHRCARGFVTPSKKITSKERERRRN